MSSLRHAAARVLEPVRRHGRPVAWTPEFMGLGNLLQLAMWAHDGRHVGEERWIRSTPRLEPWLAVFPGLRAVVLEPGEVRFTDWRVRPWSAHARAEGVDGAVPQHEQVDVVAVERFLREVVLPGSPLAADMAQDRREDRLVVNVRRGDYYSDPVIRRQYGFDQITYLKVALERSVAREGVPAGIRVVSDDVEWCRASLSWLTSLAQTEWDVDSGPVSDFATVARARRIVITNSTFSYWAAHVSNVMHGDNHAQVWVPRFFDRTQNEGASWLLDERWSVVEDLPGGWGAGDEGALP